MERKFSKKMNNRGFSIVELLIVMAIAGVVTILVGGLMINGSQWYTGETAKADLQNSVQTTNTKLQKTLMEATTLDIHTENDVLYILTGKLDSSKNWTSDSNPNNTAKAIMIYKNHMYIADKYYTPTQVKNVDSSSDLRGYEITEFLKEDGTISVGTKKNTDVFYIGIKNTLTDEERVVAVDECEFCGVTLSDAAKVYSVETPIILEVEYTLEKSNKTTRSSFEIVLRNSEVMEKVCSVVDGYHTEIEKAKKE